MQKGLFRNKVILQMVYSALLLEFYLLYYRCFSTRY